MVDANKMQATASSNYAMNLSAFVYFLKQFMLVLNCSLHGLSSSQLNCFSIRYIFTRCVLYVQGQKN